MNGLTWLHAAHVDRKRGRDEANITTCHFMVAVRLSETVCCVLIVTRRECAVSTEHGSINTSMELKTRPTAFPERLKLREKRRARQLNKQRRKLNLLFRESTRRSWFTFSDNQLDAYQVKRLKIN